MEGKNGEKRERLSGVMKREGGREERRGQRRGTEGEGVNERHSERLKRKKEDSG